jgi:hypothetical protein
MRLWSIALLAAALWATSALAQGSRPDSLRMSCRQAASLVQSRGSIVIGTGPDLYDRYVTGCNFCYSMEFLTPAWVRTADNPQCFVGYTCETQQGFPPRPSCGFTGYRGP